MHLPDEDHEAVIASIKQFVLEEFGEEIGELRAGTILDFFLREIGPSVYNQAVADAQTLISHKTSDLAGELYEPEHQYWKRG